MSDNINYIKLLHTESTVEAEQVISYLKKNNVNAYKQGDIASVYMGDSFGGADVFVLEKDMQFAKEALNNDSVYCCSNNLNFINSMFITKRF